MFSDGGQRILMSEDFAAVLSIGVQLVNHAEMNCEEAIDNILSTILIYQHTKDQRTILIADLVDRTSSPPLDGPESHSEWTGENEFDSTWLNAIDWRHTKALRQYRDNQSPLSENAKNNLESVTMRIISNSFNPHGDEDEFHWRGLIAGNVQSGKTATYSTLIARAMDVGYRLIIVLSGRLDSLRRQTSSRLNTELVINSPEDVYIHHLTADDDSIFAQTNGRYFEYISSETTGSPATLIVAKKDSTRMNQLNELLIAIRNQNPEFTNFPVLIIDDECDEAGIDIGNEDDTSSNHFSIRRLISNPSDGEIWRQKSRGTPPVIEEEIAPCPGFRKTMYVGFTATPYATVFQEMNDSIDDDELRGLDLYPRDYLLVLDDPPNYCGGEVFIGRHEVSDENPDGEITIPEIENLVETLIDIPMNSACQTCIQQTINTDDGEIRTHIGSSIYRHFWHLQGESFPTPASNFCDCFCHENEQSHIIKNPFNASIVNFQPALVDSLRDAIDDFILSGAARIQRGDNAKPSSMMILISNNSYQHFRIREIVREHIELIADVWPSLGHGARLKSRWENSFMPNIEMFDQGFELIGGGNSTEHPHRQFSPRPISYNCEYSSIAQHIPQFLHQLRHIVLNSGADVSSENGNKLDFSDEGFPKIDDETIPNLKGIFYGGYSLGRGLTLIGLTTTYVMRLPGDGSVATQIQRWCGYRSRPGEDILDLIRVYMPEVLSQNYRELITVDKINRFRLGLHSNVEPPNRPESVFHYLREPENGFALVSAAKRGRMETVLNPLSGREKTETTYRFTTDGNATIAGNWTHVNHLLQQCEQDVGIAMNQVHIGMLIRNVPVEMVFTLMAAWSSAPHNQSGFHLSQMRNYIEASIQHDELTHWSIFLPSRIGTSEIEMKDTYDEQLDHPPLEQFGELDFSSIVPFARIINGRRPTTSGSTFRIGTVTSPNWRTVDLEEHFARRPENSNPLLIITSLTHPFNRESPFSDNFQGMIELDLGNEEVHWPTVPSLSFVFPNTNTITGTELGHSQFDQN